MSSGPLALVEDWNVEAADAPLNEQQTAIQLMLDLEQAGMVTPVSLTITDPNLAYEKAEALATFWGSVNRRCSWYIGDFLLYCEQVYGQRVGQLADATGLAVSTLQHRMSVCERIPPERRVVGLSFSCHALVSRKPAAEQAYWLNEAATRGWGYEVMREAIRAANQHEQPPLMPPEDPPEDPPVEVVNMALLLDAAQAVVRDGVYDGDGVRVPVESFERLRAAFNSAL